MAQRRALLVDPDETTCRSIRSMFERLGYDVVTMSDGETAMAVFNYVRADVVLASYPMGQRATENLPAYIRRQSNAPHTPIIAMLPFADRVLARVALADGCIDFLIKPVDPEILALKLRQLVQAEGEDAARGQDGETRGQDEVPPSAV